MRPANVGAGDHIRVDVRLEVGDAMQSVEVTADASLLNVENASVGQAITTAEVEDLPITSKASASRPLTSPGTTTT